MNEPILIQPKINTPDFTNIIKKKLKVCAYCRVSTEKHEQLNSYENQVDHYENYIKENKEWEYTGIFADEAVSGTSLKNRTEFKRMVQECLNGKIDMILVKSIARFGRNTADILQYVRLLRDNNIAIYFETERINTLNSDGEVLLSIFSSLAQEESRQTSERVNWGNDKSFKKGKIYGNGNLLGYDIYDGKLIINDQQAEIVRFIFNKYIDGDGTVQICRKFEGLKIKTPSGKDKWSPSTILGILKNEKYCGHLLQQKYFTTDYLTHRSLKNKGEKRQYLFENNHEPIISQDIFNKVQEEIERRRTLQSCETGRKTKHSNKYAWSGKIICGNCKERFRRSVWHKKTVVWECMGYALQGKSFCDTGAVPEVVLNQSVRLIIIELKMNQRTIIQDIHQFIKEETKNTNNGKININNIEKRLKEIENEMSELRMILRKRLIDEKDFTNDYEKLKGNKGNLSKALEDARTKYLQQADNFDRSKNLIQKLIQLNPEAGITYENDNIIKEMIEKVEVFDKTHFRVYLASSDIHFDIEKVESGKNNIKLC